MEAGDALQLVHLEDVFGIEMYHGPGTIPGEFGGPGGMCGVARDLDGVVT